MRDIVFHFGGRLRVQLVGAVPFHFQSATPSPIDLRLVGALAPLRGRVIISPVILLALRGELLPLGGLMALAYRPDVWAPLVAGHVESFRAAGSAMQAAAGTVRTGPEVVSTALASVRAGAGLDAAGTVPIRYGRPLDAGAGDVFRAGAGLDSVLSDTFRQMWPIDIGRDVRYRQADELPAVFSDGWRQAAAVDPTWGAAIRAARALDLAVSESAGDAGMLDAGRASRFRGAALLVELSVPFPPAIVPPVPGRRPIVFHFGWIVRPKLTFHFPSVRRVARYIPIRERYIVIPDCQLVLLPGGADIPVDAFTVSVDIGLSLHGLSGAVLTREAFERLSGAGAVVELRAQGYAWRFAVNRLAGARRFGDESYTLEGMSLARTLGRGRAVPKSYLETSSKTVQQLATRELQYLYWDLDWTASSWLIPGGTWSYDRLTPLEAIQALAEAAGGYVHADPVYQILRVKPRYRVLPWALDSAQPDVILPADPVDVLSFESEPREDYTAVYAHGTTSSRKSAQVSIAGSGGFIVPDEPVTNALLTDYEGLRAFGSRYLGDHRSATRWTLSLPLTAATGDVPLLDIGQVIQFTGAGYSWRGIVEGVKVSMNGVELSQTVEVVTYG